MARDRFKMNHSDASDLPESAVDVYLDTGDVRGILGRKKRYRGRDFFRLPKRFIGTFATICFAIRLRLPVIAQSCQKLG